MKETISHLAENDMNTLFKFQDKGGFSFVPALVTLVTPHAVIKALQALHDAPPLR